MKRYLIAVLASAGFLSIAAAAAPVAHETVTGAGPAQALVDRTVRENPDLLDVLLHVTPPGRPSNLVVAAHLPQDIGEVSGADDLGVARTGKPLVEVQKDGVRIGVLLPLRDAGQRTIGALGLMFPWRAGDSTRDALRRAEAIRDGMARRIGSRRALFAAA